MQQPAVSVILVMGVSGSGKTTIGALLAGHLGWEFADGDDLHPAANVAKMRGGTPLVDDDRWPWLDIIAAWIDAHRAAGTHGVITCSALKHIYRDRLLAGRGDVRLVYLHGSFDVVAGRQAARQGHFMPASLIQSQFATLEPPGPDENPLSIAVDLPPRQIVDEVVAQLGLHRG
jgi:carbohydrate kinase (thermoresistant glucokinase family)